MNNHIQSGHFAVHVIQSAKDAFYIKDAYARLLSELSDIAGRAPSNSLSRSDSQFIDYLGGTVFLIGDVVPVSGGGWIVSVAPVKPHHREYQPCVDACAVLALILTCMQETSHA